MISGYPINKNNSNEDIYDEIKINDADIQSKGVTNVSKSFGFHITTKNIQISIVFIKRVWKRRDKIAKYVRKKTFRRISKDKQKTKSEANNDSPKPIKGVKTIKPEEFTGDRKWCWDEFERHIGVPKRWDTRPALALAYVRAKRHSHFVPEAINLKKWNNPNSVFLACDKPISKCLCPDKECFCTGDEIINKKKRIPTSLLPKGIVSRYLPILNMVCARKVDIKPLTDKLVAATGGSPQQQTSSFKKVTLFQEVCLSRCRHYHVPGDLQNIQYLPYFVRPSERAVPVKKIEDKESKPKKKSIEVEEEDDRVCNTFSCTVSTQTDTGPDGELNVGKFTHCLFSNVEETYLSDIRGKKLQITHYTRSSSDGPDMQVCVRNMEKFLDVKEMKMRVSKFLSAIYEIKDPGPPLRTCATQVPWRQRVCGSYKLRAPNRCGDKDYDIIPEIPWSPKIPKSMFEEAMKVEFEEDKEEDKNGDVCPCCELFAESNIDKETLLDDIIHVLSFPSDIRTSMSDLSEKESDDQNIIDVKLIVEEIVAKAFEELEKCCSSCCGRHIRQKKDKTDVDNERNESKTNMAKIDKELEEKEITNDNGNYKSNLNTNELVTGKDNSEVLSNLLDTMTASKKRSIEEKSNVKKSVKCDFLRPKKSNLVTSSKTTYQKKSVNSNENNKTNITDVEINSSKTRSDNDNNGICPSPSNDQLKLGLDEEHSKTNEMNSKSSVKSSKNLKEQKKSSNIQHTSKDRIVLQVNTSYKKASSAFSSLFKWLFDQNSILWSQMKNKSSLKSISKEISNTDETKLNERDSKASEREVFSMRYTSSIISVNKKEEH